MKRALLALAVSLVASGSTFAEEDVAAVAADRRALRSGQVQLARQHQSRDAGHVRLAYRARAGARGYQEQADRDGRASTGLDPVRLSGARQQAVRIQIQGRHRLREHAQNPSRDGSGEVDGTIANWSTLKAINTNWITEKKIRILAQWALQKSGER